MISFTARITKRKILVFIFVLLAIAAILLALFGQGPAEAENPVDGSTSDARIAFLSSFGWNCDPDSESEKDTVIPSVFDDVYQPYNDIQLAQGFDLSPYKGQTAKLYSYQILNYPNSGDNIYASLLVLDGVIIGGDIHSTALDGFMHGFQAVDPQ